MKFVDTVANNCRWAKLVPDDVRGAEILWEDSIDDYQGRAEIFGRCADGRYVLGGWSYGSCSGCDSWEGKDEESARAEMASGFSYLSGREALAKYLEPLTADWQQSKARAIRQELGIASA